MNLDNAAWRTAPVKTGFRVAKSLLRRAVGLSRAVVPYDGGRTSIYADLKTPLGLGLYRYGYRDHDIDLMKRLLARGEAFVDGGAHIGLFTLAAAACVGAEGSVVSFEPSNVVRTQLLKNVELNGLQQVRVSPAALSSQVGTAQFRMFDIVGSGFSHLGPVDGDDGALETVPVTTLDAALSEREAARLRLVKLDLEGAEHAALLGAAQTLRNHHPDLLLEVEPHHLARMGTAPAVLEALLREHGYGFFCTGATAEGVSSLKPLAHILAGAPYPNVFATVDVERARSRGVVLV